MTPSAYFWAALILLLSHSVSTNQIGRRLGLGAACVGLGLVLPLQAIGEFESIIWAREMGIQAQALREGKDDLTAIRILAHGETDIMAQPEVNSRSLALLRARRLNVFAQ